MEAETKADHVFPDNPSEGANLGFQHGFIAGRTISAEQLEQAAAAANAMLCQYARDGAVDIEVFNDGMDLEFSMVRAALEAAGLVIEEERPSP
ncbi:hypothetical protein JOF45_002665 [Nesterenkonia lacusekhoensis]|uniref:Transcriptional regulator n=2 Tax=Nesterenkonia lacusekhoensis TaxID=150832 RepID=A0ABS4T549_9MICC|nr:hypothetical protein [Nesterenkonia lacusekhoensis]